jgi:diguanylate cyclase (GGDEF)-like protein
VFALLGRAFARLTLLLCIAGTLPAVGAGQPMFFRHITPQDGLSQNTVTAIHQDSTGFMWFATENGLNRYDGYEVVRYHRDRTQPNGLASDFIWQIAEDASGDLWLATVGGGLVRWDRRTDHFVSYRHGATDTQHSGEDSVRAVLVASDGRIWAGTSDAGVMVLDPATGRVTRYRHDANDPKSLSNDAIFALLEDRAGLIWIGTDRGLNRFNPNSGEFISYFHDPADRMSISHDRIRALFQDANGSLWVGTYAGGLNRIGRSNETFRRFQNDPRRPDSLANDHVRAIFEDQDGRLWVGTANGLDLLDRSSNQFSHYRHDGTAEGLSDSYIMSLHQDRGGVLWVGTRAGGINTWNPRSWAFGHFRDDWLKDTSVTSFAGSTGSLWIGTFDRGLTRILGKEVRHYRKPKITDDRVMSLLLDRRGDLWIGTMDGGLNRLDPVADRVTVYRNDPAKLGADGVMSLFEDHAGRIWVGTYGGGVSVFDPRRNSWRRFDHDPDDPHSLSSPRAATLIEDSSNTMWVGTDNGLNRLDERTGRFTRYYHDPDRAESIGADSIYALHVDAGGTLWVGTAGGGVDRVQTGTDGSVRFRNFAQQLGLPSNVVYGIHSDAEGRLWLSTSNGLSQLDPTSRQVKTFHKAHGIQAEDFNFGAHHQSADGEIFFGGANGYNAFNPERLQISTPPPPLVLTGIELMNKPAAMGMPYSIARRVAIDHGDDVATFQFAALDYTAPSENRYMYRLDGFDKDWVDSGNVNRATYTNLDGGEYTFRVKAANSDGVWNEAGLALAISVAPAPWQTPWARAIYVALTLLGICAVAAVLRARRRNKLAHQAQLNRLAYYDSVTAIPNRHYFMRGLARAIDNARTRGTQVGLVYVDLDQFKRINDTLGHLAGDAFLKLVAERLMLVTNEAKARARSAGRETGFELARMGGDEFVIVVTDTTGEPEVIDVAEAVRGALGSALRYQRHDLVITPSIGVSMYPRDGDEVNTLLRNADTAMYEAKEAGRNQHRVYSATMSDRVGDRLRLESDLRGALERRELVVHYQAKVALDSLTVVGAEALLRWHHPERGPISPAVFVPLAEESGLILDIDRYVAAEVVNQLASWRAEGLSILPVAINLSGREFSGTDAVRVLRQLADAAGIELSYLDLEITETALMSNAADARTTLAALKALGFRISVDDFGTGYSSLGYLKRFALDTLKIDRSFVRDLHCNAQDLAICRAIIAMAHGLGIRVVAEGVETEAQATILRTEGCDEAQGFYFHRPQPAHLFVETLRETALLSTASWIDRKRPRGQPGIHPA